MDAGRRPSFRPSVECLEDRMLLTAHLSASLSNGLLRIQAVGDVERVYIREIGHTITVDHTPIHAGSRTVTGVDTSAVKKIEVVGLDADDHVYVERETRHGLKPPPVPVVQQRLPNGVADGDRDNVHPASHPAPHSPTPRPAKPLAKPTKPPVKPPAKPRTRPRAATTLQTQVYRLISLTDNYRASHHLRTLTVNRQLTQAAQNMANFLAGVGQLTHTGAKGQGLGARVAAAGFAFSWTGENVHVYDPASGRTAGIAHAYARDQLAQYYFDGWRVSPEHNRNLLAPQATAIGVALAQAPSGKIFAVEILARPG